MSLLSFEDATLRLLALATRTTPSAERVPLDDADGRILAEDVISRVDTPAFDHSTMDGYAVRAETIAQGGASLEVHGESRAGHPVPPLAPGTTMRIFTGARLPEGADAVVMQENVTVASGRASFSERPAVGTAVRYRASDLRLGDVALRRGTGLGPADVALAATCDVGTVMVARRPRVTVLTNGDELRSPGSEGPAGTLPESNGIAIATMARRAGAVVTRGATLPDDRAVVAKALDEALASADLVITIGGVSVGDHDVVKGALADAGVTLDFWRVAIKPGKPLAVGSRGAAIVLGLPGNPASAMVTFGLFGVPLVRSLAGDSAPRPVPRPAVLGHAVAHDPGRMELVRARVETEGARLVARAVKHQASGAGIGMSVANALVVVPRESHGLDEGAVVETYPFEELCL